MRCLSFLFPPKLGSAELVVIQPNSAQTGRRIAIKFILRSYKLSKQNSYAEQSIPGLPGAPLQFLRGQPRLLSIVMYFDAREENRDVRELTSDVAEFMKVDRTTHAPPVLRFEWKGLSLPCVLESATEEIFSLFPDGRPSRAKLLTTFREMRTLADLQEELARE
ncbi:MAG: LysM protein [Burkholderiaceae bacterium]|nr:LysM protein [Burkholderiaceae bacterium]